MVIRLATFKPLSKLVGRGEFDLGIGELDLLDENGMGELGLDDDGIGELGREGILRNGKEGGLGGGGGGGWGEGERILRH